MKGSTKPNTMADEQKKGAAKAGAVAKDRFGNPEGTTYNELGKALPLGMGLIDLPQSAEGQPPVLYNEDGSIFTVPANADKTISTLKADITGLGIAISKGHDRVKTATEMMADADDADKAIFGKSINSQNEAIASNTKKKEELEKQLEDFRLSLVTPSQRATERRLTQACKERDELIEEIKQLENMKRSWSVDTKPAPTAGVTPASTAEQTTNRENLIKEHGTQGKAIIHLVKLGWKNNEIASHMGIPPASVPGPKNAWKESPEGVKFMADHPGLVK